MGFSVEPVPIQGKQMKVYSREYPKFSLCGLNCGLCPRYQTDGASKCPGCGGPDFYQKHPSCAVINCTLKHDQVEYCFQCASYPCEKYRIESNQDSFITYRNVLADFEKAKTEGQQQYKLELNEKVEILEYLIHNFNDGRRKNFYCIAVNLLSLARLREIIQEIQNNVSPQNIDQKSKIEQIITLFEVKAKLESIEIKLRI